MIVGVSRKREDLERRIDDSIAIVARCKQFGTYQTGRATSAGKAMAHACAATFALTRRFDALGGVAHIMMPVLIPSYP